MASHLVDSKQLLAARKRVVARNQEREDGLAVATAFTATSMQSRIRGERWQRLYRGVYASFSGDPGRAVLMWAALLRAGNGAVFSHQTAAEIQGFLGRPSSLIHVTVPAERHPARWAAIPGVVIHRSVNLERTRHPLSSVPITRVEETVLDLVEQAADFEEKFGWVAAAVGARVTTAERIAEALALRRKFPARAEAQLALGHVGQGIMSWLELQWASKVEHPHGLPAARRQVRVRQESGNRYLDNLYEEYRLCVELDGKAAHPESDQRHDAARDRWNLAYEQLVTMRFRVVDLNDQEHACRSAAEFAAVLNDRRPAEGPLSAEVGRPCCPGCPVGAVLSG
jgi:very-short-patch-repair endonuclease